MTDDERAACECVAEAVATAGPPVLTTVSGCFFHGTNVLNATQIVERQEWRLPRWEEMQNRLGPSVCVFSSEPPILPSGPADTDQPAAPFDGWGNWAAANFADAKIKGGRMTPPPAIVEVELAPCAVLDFQSEENRDFVRSFHTALKSRANLKHMNPECPLEFQIGFAINRGRKGFTPGTAPNALAFSFCLGLNGWKHKGLAIIETASILRTRLGAQIA